MPRARILSAVALAGLLGLFAVLKAFALWPTVGDENIYFYMATRVADGLRPWHDFFFAHPPLHLLPATLLALVIDFRLPLFKAIPGLAAAGAGLFLWRAVRHAAGAGAAFAALILLLFSYDYLRASSHYTGVNLGLLFLTAALDASVRSRPRLAGGLLACAAGTALYFAPVGAALALVAVWRTRREGLRMVGAGLAAFALVNLLGLAAGGLAYVQQVYLYHLAKPAAEGMFLRAAGAIAYHNPLLVAGAPLGLAACLLPGDARTDRNAAAALWGLPIAAGLAFVATLSRVFHFYFLPLFPFFAALGGIGLTRLARSLSDLARTRSPRQACVPAVLLALLAAAEPIRHFGLSQQSWAARVGERRTYVFRGSPLPDPVDTVVRLLFWRDHRIVGDHALGITRYLWHESRIFVTAEDLVEATRRSVPPGPLFGDSTSTPLVALLAGRRIAADEVDTNVMRFASGATPLLHVLERLQGDPPAALVMRPGRGIATRPLFRRFTALNYRRAAAFRDPYQGPYELWIRK